jgi:DmsE family decaheme c-type cytochrome
MTKAESSVEDCVSCHKSKKTEMQFVSHHPIPEGKMTCTGCHNPHGGEKGNMNGVTVADTCFKCHADKAGPYPFEHPPVVEDCMICHRPHGSPNESLLKQSQPFLCIRCHKAPHVNRTGSGLAGQANGRALSVNVFEQRDRCTDCHREIHGSNRSFSLKN